MGVAIADSAGAVVEKYTYSPYGVSGAEGTSGFPFRFTGQKLDAETGLYYYKARFYHPETGRFLQTDPVGYADQMSLYAYVANDPVNGRDPLGLHREEGGNRHNVERLEGEVDDLEEKLTRIDEAIEDEASKEKEKPKPGSISSMLREDRRLNELKKQREKTERELEQKRSQLEKARSAYEHNLQYHYKDRSEGMTDEEGAACNVAGIVACAGLAETGPGAIVCSFATAAACYAADQAMEATADPAAEDKEDKE